jgi:hypothetical protein
MRIGYFVHDLADAAVHRRVRMMNRLPMLLCLGSIARTPPSFSSTESRRLIWAVPWMPGWGSEHWPFYKQP